MTAPDMTALGATLTPDGVAFAVWSSAAERLWLCLFDGEREAERIPLRRGRGHTFAATVPGLGPGARYGLRADGPWNPRHGLHFDPRKLLVDPYAKAIDRPFAWNPRLAAPREEAVDTAHLVPKAIVQELPPPEPRQPPVFKPGGLIYEIPVRAFSLLHPDVPPPLRGTVAALAHPAILDHLTRLGVDAVELMPIAAWIDERHLPPLGLANAWGYNPVAFMAPDPRLCPGGLPELAATVATLRAAGIGTILDVVFNHTGEGDAHGPTLGLRGLDPLAYFRHDHHGRLVNDTGTGNTLACDHPATRRLVLDTLGHFVAQAGVDGFRFDLAPVLGRTAHGFDPHAETLRAITADPLLKDRILIAEPWDVGPGGYQLGRFPPPWLEWNDRFRDRVRRFWRGDGHMLGDFATALAGSSDTFPPPATRTVNFIAVHDGFTLADLVAYRHKHNQANGEGNRDGHGENLSWNNGVEGPTADPAVTAARRRDQRALLATLFASRGTIMLAAGDEFGRTQSGNNNAYAQDSPLAWLDWTGRDRELEAHAGALAALRRARPELADPRLLTGVPGPDGIPDVAWLTPAGDPKTPEDWQNARGPALAMVLGQGGNGSGSGRLAVLFNRSAHTVTFHLPARPGSAWAEAPHGRLTLGPRAVAVVRERPA
jgi:glycogen operon protein